MKKLHLVAAVAMLVCSPASGQPGRESFEYVMWLTPNKLEIEMSAAGDRSRSIVVGGHVRYETKFCGESSRYDCFISAELAFAVPKKGEIEGTWSVDGLEFSVLEGGKHLQLLGEDVSDVFVIRCPAGSVFPENDNLMLYSPTRGLVAIATEDLRSVYWLSGRQGFAARE
jgi:hypothetical protein